MTPLIFACVALFMLACAGLASAYVNAHAIELEKGSHARELAAVKKVGGWYEKRVEELEYEARQLAAQIVTGGIAPRATAMPLDPRDDAEYGSDPYGINIERLNPRDLPVA